jgi:hypothetical protein
MLARRHPRVLAGRSRVLGTTEELVPQ